MSLDNNGLRVEPVSLSERPVSVVLVGIGPDPRAVAELLQTCMSVTVTDLDALGDALPLMLYEKLERSEAEQLRFRLQLIGAEVELRVPRDSLKSFGTPFGPTMP